MKTRISLVSNSSTSSYIVALPKDQEATIKVTIEFPLHGEVVDTLEKLDNASFRMFKYNPKAPDSCTIGAQKNYEDAKKLILKGQKLIYGRVSSESDDPMECFMVSNMTDIILYLQKNMTIVQPPWRIQ